MPRSCSTIADRLLSWRITIAVKTRRSSRIAACSRENTFELSGQKFEGDVLSHCGKLVRLVVRVNQSGAFLKQFAANQHAADLGGAGAIS